VGLRNNLKNFKKIEAPKAKVLPKKTEEFPGPRGHEKSLPTLPAPVQSDAKAAPAWRNPTAYCIAKRTREGTLEPVISIDELDEEQLTSLLTALLGTQYMAMRKLFTNSTAIRILLQDDIAFKKSLNDEALAAFQEEQRGADKEKCSPKKKKLTKRGKSSK
jgi:hypothetical protein